MRYDFLCRPCDEVFEVVKKHDDTSPVACPNCEGTDTHKLFLTTPLFYVSWRNTLGLGSDGQLVLPSVTQSRRRQDA